MQKGAGVRCEPKELGLCPEGRESQGRVLSRRAVWGIPLGWSEELGGEARVL